MIKYKGKGLIAQSGGPTAVINASLVGAVLRARASLEITEMIGSRNALEGCLSGNTILFNDMSREYLTRIAKTPGAALQSSRKKVGADISEKAVLDYIVKNDVRFFFYIGGNDSAENARRINQEAKNIGYNLATIHIPKTIDNDLLENDHTPGFGSAAKYVASAVRGDILDNLSLSGIKINVVMGRSAGFLAASSALGGIGIDGSKHGENKEDKKHNNSTNSISINSVYGPHLIYVPEIKFSKEKFVEDLSAVYSKYGRALVVVSEGINDGAGNYLASNGKFDSHGNPELDGAILAKNLTSIVNGMGVKRVRADVFGYLQRSFPGVVSMVDFCEAFEVGNKAVEFAIDGNNAGSVAIKRTPGKVYGVKYELVPLENVAKDARPMPREYMNENGNNVSPAFLDYARPIVGDLPLVAILK